MVLSEVRSILSSFLNILFPPVCPLCEKGLLEDGDQGLCGSCIGGFKRIKDPVCTVCGAPFASGAAPEHTCGECLNRTMPFVKARSVFFYEGGVLEAIHRFKYSGKVELSAPLGRVLAASIGPARPDLIVPVPLHKKRLKERGFNQSLLLAKEVGKRLGIKVDFRNLGRIKLTEPQVNLKLKERLENVKGAFMVKDPGALRGKRVLLVDDVLTTGSTVRECAKALKKAGAEVYVATLARAVKV